MSKTVDPNTLMSEAEFQKWVIDLATLFGWTYMHTPDSRKTPAGWPDLVFAKEGENCIFAELKSEKGRLRPEQEWWINRLVDSGCDVFIWRPSNRAAIEARFKK